MHKSTPIASFLLWDDFHDLVFIFNCRRIKIFFFHIFLVFCFLFYLFSICHTRKILNKIKTKYYRKCVILFISSKKLRLFCVTDSKIYFWGGTFFAWKSSLKISFNYTLNYIHSIGCIRHEILLNASYLIHLFWLMSACLHVVDVCNLCLHRIHSISFTQFHLNEKKFHHKYRES